MWKINFTLTLLSAVICPTSKVEKEAKNYIFNRTVYFKQMTHVFGLYIDLFIQCIGVCVYVCACVKNGKGRDWNIKVCNELCHNSSFSFLGVGFRPVWWVDISGPDDSRCCVQERANMNTRIIISARHYSDHYLSEMRTLKKDTLYSLNSVSHFYVGWK